VGDGTAVVDVTTRYETSGLGASAVLLALHLPVGLSHTIAEVRYRGQRSGRRIALPVSYVRSGDEVVVRVGNAGAKTWWRNFRSPHPVSIRADGTWLTGMGRLVVPGTPEHERFEAAYRQGHRREQAVGNDPYVVIGAPVHATPPRRASLWRRWFLATTLGEFLGFFAPAITGALTDKAAAVVTAVALLCAGAIEGSVLGWFQAGALRPALPRLRTRRWVAATAAGAVIAWAIGSVPILYGERISRWPVWVQVPFAVAAGIAIVLCLGIAQWTVLRDFTDRAALWIWANAAGWIAGLLAFTLVAPPLWHPGQSSTLVVAIGAFGGLVMAATVAAVTGAFLGPLLRAPARTAGDE
jgi:hypothetical protein